MSISPPIYKKFKIGFIDNLRPTKAFADRNSTIVSLLILVSWLIVVIVICTKHELERDEVRALSVALEPDAFWKLLTTLKNEGHPILWYLILRIGFLITHSFVILKIVSICIAFGSVVIFYKYAPFPLWQKILFLYSILPMYEYSVMARNYGISMLLFFLFATFYTQRNQKPFLVASILVALANTNVHSCIFVCVIAAFWFFDVIILERHSLNFRLTTVFLCAFAFIGIGIALTVVTCLPTQDTIVLKAFSLETKQVLKAFLMNIMHPGMHFSDVFWDMPAQMRDVLLWVLIAGLFIRPLLAASLYVGIVLLGLFFSIGFGGELRHQGLFIIFMISLYWIAYQEIPMSIKGKLRQYLLYIFKTSVYIVLTVIIAVHIKFAGVIISKDLLGEMSSNKAFGKFLNTNSQYRKSIILGEPDYLLESLPYYVRNQIYIPREGLFRNYVKFTRSSREKLSLGELLNSARQVRNSEKRPVIIALGHFDLSKQSPPFEKRYSYNKLFTWSSNELADFRAATVKVAEFKSAKTDENYEIYLLR